MNFFNDLISIDLDNKVINGLNDELKSIYIYNFFKKSNKSILVVTNSLYEANKFYKSLSFYSKDILFFPMDDFLTSEALAISPELKISRLETLNNLDGNKIIVTNLMGLLRYLPSKSIYLNSFINLSIGNEYDMNKLIDDLYRIGYSRETYVNKTGEFAVRGFVIDIFPISYSYPIRIEFFGDEIDTIKSFDLESQISKSVVDNVVIKPNSEFIVKDNIDVSKCSQKDLIKYGSVSSIYEYIDNCLVFYNNYNDILVGYKNLVEDIFNYNVEKELDSNTSYMFDLDYFSKFDSYYLSNFDDIHDNLKSVKYISGNILEVSAIKSESRTLQR